MSDIIERLRTKHVVFDIAGRDISLEAADTIESLRQRVKELGKDNDSLRGLLGNSAKDCPYCGLPAVDQAKCKYGFPGCSRADDQMLSQHFASGYALECCEKELAALKQAQSEPVAQICSWGCQLVGEIVDTFKIDPIPLLGTPLYTSVPTIPEGWQLVPIEPTEAMLLAYTKCRTTSGERWAQHQWKAMLAAAPKSEVTK